MNLTGIGNPLGNLRFPPAESRPRVEQEKTPPSASPATTQAPRAEPAAKAAAPAASSSLPVEAPPGTDPELWAVLSKEERAFFAKVGAMGPLTYGHIMTSQANGSPTVRGGRLDVRA